MTPAVFDQTTVDIVAKAKLSYDFRVTGSVLKFDGHLKFEEEEKRCAPGGKGQGRQGRKATPKQACGNRHLRAKRRPDGDERSRAADCLS